MDLECIGTLIFATEFIGTFHPVETWRMVQRLVSFSSSLVCGLAWHSYKVELKKWQWNVTCWINGGVIDWGRHKFRQIFLFSLSPSNRRPTLAHFDRVSTQHIKFIQPTKKTLQNSNPPPKKICSNAKQTPPSNSASNSNEVQHSFDEAGSQRHLHGSRETPENEQASSKGRGRVRWVRRGVLLLDPGWRHPE